VPHERSFRFREFSAAFRARIAMLTGKIKWMNSDLAVVRIESRDQVLQGASFGMSLKPIRIGSVCGAIE